MSWLSKIGWLTLAAAMPAWSAQAQKQPQGIDQLVDRITAKERQEVNTIRRFRPIVETYIQDTHSDKDLGFVPVKDHYFIGIADLAKGQVIRSMKEQKAARAKHSALDELWEPFSAGYNPAGFLEMIFVDPNGFDRHHYIFDYVHREFLGEVRCLVFDVVPAPHSGNGRFKGRIWVEDREYSIVRFNGVFEPSESKYGFNIHFDSWRLNAGPDLWLPTYVYTEQIGLSNSLFSRLNEKSQTRLWGYESRKATPPEEFAELKVESPDFKDESDVDRSLSPIEQQREWGRRADLSVIDRLERAGLVAPSAGADKILNTVVNNLEVTNNMDLQPEVNCRVLNTSTLEISSIGHTILISRGLLDVLPDEPSLAWILAHELSHVVLENSPTSLSVFADQVIFPDEESLRRFSFHTDEGDEQATNEKALALFRNSPYKEGLASAGLFLRQIDAEAKQLPALISAHLTDRSLFPTDLLALAPPLEPKRLDQIAALPLGSRIKLNPWDGTVDLMKSKRLELASPQEKMPLGLAPFYPYLTRVTFTSSN